MGALCLILFALWLVLYLTKGRFLRGPFERTLSAQLHRSVKTRGDFQLFLDPFDVKLVVAGLTVRNPDYATKPYLISAERLQARIASLTLFRKKWRLRELELANAGLDLEWDKAHRRNSWTFSDRKGGEPLTLPVIDRATLSGTTLRYRDPRLRLLADLRFQTIRSADARIGSAVRFAGRGQIRATPFTTTGALLSPDETVQRGRNQLTLRAYAADNVIDMRGTLPSLAALEDVPLAVAARGRNLARLLDVIGITVPDTRRYALASQLILHEDQYRFTRMHGRFGDSDLSGAFTVHNIEPRVRVEAMLATHRLDIVDAAPFMGYNPDEIAAKGAAGAITHVRGAPRLLPDARLRIEALRAFDAGLRWHIDTVRSRTIPLADIDLRLSLEDRLLKLVPLTFTMARGRVTSDVTIDARMRPVRTTYDVRLLPTPISQLLAGFGAIEAGTTGTVKGRAELIGDGDSVRDSLASARGRIAFVLPSGTFWMRNVQLVELDLGVFFQRMLQNKLKQPVRINCGLVAFTVRNGLATADPILIDTAKNVIAGRGSFSFRDERLDLAIRADAKTFSLLSGQSPVGLGGYFAAPVIRPLSTQLFSRSGIGLGLAALAPPAALLAFVDPGDAKSAACGPVLAGARASAQRTSGGQKRRDVGTVNTHGVSKRKKFLGLF
ncbi:AsmA family protein [Sphingomonas sp. BIUV-7]|uniref:AsmA family protein n=1 Tax=Sphingomonas natans TaxID=3063330 RepID=A0ABT8YD87_9SPHN|nr:AsmA family protein [Sphingomonas sp. BIUV-7]MDO6416303.1 AsmA family protein [Sphingomonas sp. BIUV-7]